MNSPKKKLRLPPDWIAPVLLFVFVFGSGVVLLFVPNVFLKNTRQPSSVSYHEVWDDPAAEVHYADESIEDLSEGPDLNKVRKSHRVRLDPRPFILLARDSTRIREEARRKTGLQAKRAQRVRLNSSVWRNVRPPGFMNLELFQDTALRIQMHNPSVFDVNFWHLVGQVEGDPSSKVNIMFDGEKMRGTIETGSKHYQILYAGAPDVHLILEL